MKITVKFLLISVVFFLMSLFLINPPTTKKPQLEKETKITNYCRVEIILYIIAFFYYYFDYLFVYFQINLPETVLVCRKEAGEGKELGRKGG
jgi:uncharacterized membrane protein